MSSAPPSSSLLITFIARCISSLSRSDRSMTVSHQAHAIALRLLNVQSRQTGSVFLTSLRHKHARTLRTVAAATNYTYAIRPTTTLLSPLIRCSSQTKTYSRFSRAFSSAQSPQNVGLFNTPGSLRRRVKQGLWFGIGVGAVVSTIGIAWSPSYREQATIFSAAIFRSVATFVAGYIHFLKRNFFLSRLT